MNTHYEIYANRVDNGNQIDQGFTDFEKFKKTLAAIQATSTWCGVKVEEVIGRTVESWSK